MAKSSVLGFSACVSLKSGTEKSRMSDLLVRGAGTIKQTSKQAKKHTYKKKLQGNKRREKYIPQLHNVGVTEVSYKKPYKHLIPKRKTMY